MVDCRRRPVLDCLLRRSLEESCIATCHGFDGIGMRCFGAMLVVTRYRVGSLDMAVVVFVVARALHRAMALVLIGAESSYTCQLQGQAV